MKFQQFLSQGQANLKPQLTWHNFPLQSTPGNDRTCADQQMYYSSIRPPFLPLCPLEKGLIFRLTSIEQQHYFALMRSLLPSLSHPWRPRGC